MEKQLRQIREHQKETWNKFSPGWRKWDGFTMEWFKPMRDEIIHSLQLAESDIVLDVAAGSGEPGLTIATFLKKGKVVITDIAEGMLEAARENARRKGVTNYETVACDVSELPFAANSFDAVSCRFGFMFFPDMLMAAKEMGRVLKPGGRISIAVWGLAEKNFWISAILNTIHQELNLPAVAPGSPGMFRCGEPGLLAGVFKEAGFRNLHEKEVTGKLYCITNEHYWNIMNEVAPPVASAMSKAGPLSKDKIKKEVFRLLDERYPEKDAAFDYSALVLAGQK